MTRQALVAAAPQLDTTTWPMRGRSAAHTGRSSLAGPPAGGVLWSHLFSTDLLSLSAVRGSPAIGPTGTLYVASNADKVHALTPAGAVLWEASIEGDTWSSPAVGRDGTVYIGSESDSLYAFDGATGARLWRLPTGGDIKSSPTLFPALGSASSKLVVGSNDTRVYCVSSAGTVLWTYQTGGPVRSSAAIGLDGTVYVGSDDSHLYALDGSSGQLRWRVSLDGLAVGSSPALAPDGTVYVGSDASRLYAVSPAGVILWRFTMLLGVVESSPAIGPDGTVYVGSDNGRLYAVRPDGTAKWAFTTLLPVRGSPAVDVAGVVYFGSQDHKVYALRDDGTAPTLLWSKDLGGSIWGSPAIGRGSVVYIGSDANRLVALGGAPQSGRSGCLSGLGSSCTCLCDYCLAELDGCGADSGCAAIRDCGVQRGCAGELCYQADTCMDVIDRYGGPYGDSVVKAQRLVVCIQDQCASCVSH